MYPVDEDTFLPWKIRLIKIVVGFIAVVVMGFFVVSNLRQTLSPTSRYQLLFERTTPEKISKVDIGFTGNPREIKDKQEIQKLISAFRNVRVPEGEGHLGKVFWVEFHFVSGEQPIRFGTNESSLEADLGPEVAAALRPYIKPVE